MTITVYGSPAPKGSKKLVGRDGKGRGILVESSKSERPWSEAVKWAALEARERVAGPVDVEMVFTMRKPESAPKRRRTWPDRKPDIDKLCRSVLDAIVAVNTIEDDARVIRLLARKVFPGEDPDSLMTPGAVIRIRKVGV